MVSPVARKFCIKPGVSLLLVNAPEGAAATLGELPASVQVGMSLRQGPIRVILLFCASAAALESDWPAAKDALEKNGGRLWVLWPKGKRRAGDGLGKFDVQRFGLAHGLVDVKIASFDDIWSAMAFCWRIKDR